MYNKKFTLYNEEDKEHDEDHGGREEAEKVTHEDATFAFNNFKASYSESLGEEKYIELMGK